MQSAYHARSLRLIPKLAFTISIGLITTVASYKAAAQVNVYTDPVGFITLTAEGTSGPGVSPANSFWGLGMTQIPTSRGLVTGVSSNQVGTGIPIPVGCPDCPVPDGGQFYNQFYLEDLGSNGVVGFTDDIISNDNSGNVYTETDDHLYIKTGDAFKIYPHQTLATVFGTNDSAGLNPGTSGSADLVLVQNPSTKLFSTYYYAAASKTLSAGWKNAATANADASLVPLYQDQGIIISRQVSTNLTVQLVGGVKLGPTLIPFFGPGNTFAANVYATSATTLSNSMLYVDGVDTDSLVAGTSGSADLVLIHNDAAGTFATYYYAAASKTLSAGWKNAATANADASQTQIPLGANIVIQLQPGHTGFNWGAPAPY
jgi:uncharacterized protein (TIGR02597 family)